MILEPSLSNNPINEGTYCGKEHLQTPPKSLLLAQTENYIEYSRSGKGMEKPKARRIYMRIFILTHRRQHRTVPCISTNEMGPPTRFPLYKRLAKRCRPFDSRSRIASDGTLLLTRPSRSRSTSSGLNK
ncbi:hypothetical protein GQX74_013694 [Glossina fuscipes]|nr:hypothetical protein GQX74_013694 [Glossina fuscipes]